jgi:hypothetical protein
VVHGVARDLNGHADAVLADLVDPRRLHRVHSTSRGVGGRAANVSANGAHGRHER